MSKKNWIDDGLEIASQPQLLMDAAAAVTRTTPHLRQIAPGHNDVVRQLLDAFEDDGDPSEIALGWAIVFLAMSKAHYEGALSVATHLEGYEEKVQETNALIDRINAFVIRIDNWRNTRG